MKTEKCIQQFLQGSKPLVSFSTWARSCSAWHLSPYLPGTGVFPPFLPSGVCGRSQEILPRHSLVDTQPRSGAATSRTEAVIPVRGWTGLLLPPRLFSLPHLPLLYPASSDEEEWGQHLKRLESSPECPKGLSARKSGSYKGLRWVIRLLGPLSLTLPSKDPVLRIGKRMKKSNKSLSSHSWRHFPRSISKGKTKAQRFAQLDKNEITHRQNACFCIKTF